MPTVYSFAAVFFMAIAAVCAYYNLTTRSPFFLTILGKQYARESKIVTGTLDRIDWGVGGGYWMVCHVDGYEQEIRLPYARIINGDNTYTETRKPISLVLIKDEKFDVFLPRNHKNSKSYQECAVLNGAELTPYAQKAQVLFSAAIAGGLIGFACMQSAPIVSCAAFFTAALGFRFTKPLLDWKNCEECCKINKTEQKQSVITCVDAKVCPFPADYDYWSPVQKELYDISARLDAEKTAEQRTTRLHESDTLEDGWTNIELPESDNPDQVEEAFCYNEVALKACGNCGYIIDSDVSDCPNYGAPPQKLASNMYEAQDTVEEKEALCIEDETPLCETASTNIQNEKMEALANPTRNEPCTEGVINVLEAKEEKSQCEVPPKRGKKSRNRRHRAVNSNSTDVDKMISSLEAPADSLPPS